MQVTSYALALYIVAAGFPCRGAEQWPDGRIAYQFDNEAEAVKPAFFKTKEVLDRAKLEAERVFASPQR